MLSVNKNSTITQKASGWLEIKKDEIVQRYGDAKSFALAFNPSVQKKCAMNLERSLTGDAPTIRQLLHTYQMEHLHVWVMAQIVDLNEYVGVKNKMSSDQMKDLAFVLIEKSDFLKASEILLFFYKLKAGDFGSFYGTVDPMKVGDNFNFFMQWRSQELDRVYNKQAKEQRERQRKEWQRTAITREEYKKKKHNPTLSQS